MLKDIEKKLRQLEFKSLINWINKLPQAKQGTALQFLESLYNRKHTLYTSKEEVGNIINLEAYNFTSWCNRCKIKATKRDQIKFVKLASHFFKIKKFLPTELLLKNEEQEFTTTENLSGFKDGKMYLKHVKFDNKQDYIVVSNSKRPIEEDKNAVNYYVDVYGIVSFVSTYGDTDKNVEQKNKAVIYLHKLFNQKLDAQSHYYLSTTKNLEKLKILEQLLEIPESKGKAKTIENVK